MWCGELVFSLVPVNPGSRYAVLTRCRSGLLVACASGVHPVPSRTRPLSLTAPMVLGGQPPGRVGRRQETSITFSAHSKEWALGFKAMMPLILTNTVKRGMLAGPGTNPPKKGDFTMASWEYCILTRLSAGLDTKWYANRVFQHTETTLPEEETEPEFRAYNKRFDAVHASKVFPILPAVLNLLGAEGWELIDDMDTGMTGGEGLVLKRQLTASPRGAGRRAAKAPSRRSTKKTTARSRR